MSKSLARIEIDLHSNYLSTLNISRFIQTKPFREAFAVASEQEKLVAEQHIFTLDKVRLSNWTKDIIRKYNLIEVLTMRDLRIMAQECGVRNYSIISRMQLIMGIKNHYESHNGNITSISTNGTAHYPSGCGEKV